MEKPKNILDLVENINSYIQVIRGLPREEAMNTLNFLENYVKDTIKNLDNSNLDNKELVVKITDTLYRKAVNFEIVDVYTNGYIAIVLNRLFFELGQKGAHIFYVLDNSLRDDRFHSILEQIPPAGFSIVTPHIADNLGYKPTNTQTDNLQYEEVEKKIKEALEYKRNIIYIERDSSVNYLEKVTELARNASDEYAKILRNTAPDSDEIFEIR